MTRFAIERLIRFNDQQISRLFGPFIAAATREIVERRQQGLESALDALRRQYPDYLAELEVRFLRQSTLHREMARYQSLFDEGLISREVYDDLTRSTQGTASARQRPPFDIGLDTHQLVKRLDLLAGLDEVQLESVCRLLRPRLAVPFEQIIRKGERGDAVYFIASGAVEVILSERRARIGAGEFFGELALLSGRPRQADVVALTYCQLLMLRRTDFELFMQANPEARDTILRVADARRRANMSDRDGSHAADEV